MAAKKLWTLWDINNRWLRALVSWVFVSGTILIYPLILLVFISLVLFIGAIEFYSSVRDHIREEAHTLLLTRREWRLVAALLTAREKPRE